MAVRFVLLVFALAFSHVSGIYRAEAWHRVGWGRSMPKACLVIFVLSFLAAIVLGTEVLR